MTSDFRLGISEKVSKYRTLMENLEGFKSFGLSPPESAIQESTFQNQKSLEFISILRQKIITMYV